jgi:hypothetical protein
MISLRDWKTYYRLGLGNLARVALYRLGLKSRLHPVLRQQADIVFGPYFLPPPVNAPVAACAREAPVSELIYFGRHRFGIDGRPDWHLNPFTEHRADADAHWSSINDFDPAIGDIKTVWEASRFDWALPMAQHAALGEEVMRARLNDWLTDWCASNPPYRGSNWKCGQEASIRVMHLLLCALILGQHKKPSEALVSLIKLHLDRIAPTLSYAMAQQNNHGTSEAAALFIGGDFLARQGISAGHKWHGQGRQWLENRARMLIENDGSFSQYSVVYHRLVLDTYSLCETWRRSSDLPHFSMALITKIGAATRWLYSLTDELHGDAPNIGANDGAHIAKLTKTDYRDFRPSVQWAAALFCQKRAYAEPGAYDQQLVWFGLPTDLPVFDPPQSESFDDGGWHVLRQSGVMAVMRYPRFKFRPSQADAMHVDLWISGHNLLKDAGTYSYNALPSNVPDLSVTTAHNSITFDDRDQMPRLSKFLFGSWLQASNVQLATTDKTIISASAGYIDAIGARHDRTICLSATSLTCIDIIGGLARKATLRWHLAGSNWRLQGDKAVDHDTGCSIQIETTGDARLTTSIESRYYLEKSVTTVLEINLPVSSRTVTIISFAAATTIPLL